MRKIIFLIGLLFIITGCNTAINYTPLGGDGEVVEHITTNFSDESNKIVIEDVQTDQTKINLNFLVGVENKIVIRTDKNILETFKVTYSNNQYTITGENIYRYRPTEMDIDIIGVKIGSLNLQGNYQINDTENNFTVTKFTLDLNGIMSGSLDLSKVTDDINVKVNGIITMQMKEILCENVNLNLNGTSDLVLFGTTQKLDLGLNGVVNLQTGELSAKIVYMDVDGTANIVVKASDSLTIQADGVGTIRYLGSPEIASSVNGLITVKPF